MCMHYLFILSPLSTISSTKSLVFKYYSCADVDSITVRSAPPDGDVGLRDLNVYCGMRRPPMLMSSSASMELLFVTGPQSENTARGFTLVFEFVTGKIEA